MDTNVTTRPAIDILASLPVGAEFSANGRPYRMGDGFELYPAAGKGTFNVQDMSGRVARLMVKPTTRVRVHEYR